MVDGASLPYAIWRIILPVSAPALTVAAIFAFLNAWKRAVLRAHILDLHQPADASRCPVGIPGHLMGRTGPDEQAAIMWAVLPTAVVDLVLQRRLMEAASCAGASCSNSSPAAPPKAPLSKEIHWNSSVPL